MITPLPRVRTRRPSRTALVAAALAATLVLAGCGDDGDDSSDADTTTTSVVAESQCPQLETQPTMVVPEEVTARGKPEVTVPEAPATELIVHDVIEGTGAAVEDCDGVVAHYVGVGQQTGQEFDASWDGEPIAFQLDGVIEGWQEGLVGMKVGGRRDLIIPGDMAYGANPREGSGIQPDETLVFTVDLTEVVKPGPAS